MRDDTKRAATIDVWRIRTPARAPARGELRVLLSPDEIQRAEALEAGGASARFITTRGALRLLLARRIGADPASLAFDYSANGKPALRPVGGRHVHFSVSHAGDMALVALSRTGAVGVDVERIRHALRVERIAARLFDADTCNLLASLSPAERRTAFHHAWTQREAFVKAVGGTLFATRVPLTFRWPRPPHADVQHVARGASWTVAPLDAGAGYVASVVAAGEAGRIIVHDLQ